MKHFGDKSQYENKESILFRQWENWGMGALFYEPMHLPTDARRFVEAQYNRFHVPLDHSICALCSYGLETFKMFLDYYDPYMLFHNWSDVTMTNDWSDRTYELLIDGKYEEVDPELIETYRYVPGQANAFFNEFIAKPGTGALEPWMFQSFECWLNEGMYDHDCASLFDCEGNVIDFKLLRFNVEMMCMHSGEFKKKVFEAYFDLSLWAAILWMFGPLSTNYRMEANEITYEAIKSGQEVILYEGSVFGPEYYRRVDRLPRSCYRCGTSGWCVENVLDDEGVFRFMCEGCMTKGMKRFDGATCGTKFCRFWECPHNLYYQNNTGGINSMRSHGQLGNKAQEARKTLDTPVKRQAIG